MDRDNPVLVADPGHSARFGESFGSASRPRQEGCDCDIPSQQFVASAPDYFLRTETKLIKQSEAIW